MCVNLDVLYKPPLVPLRSGPKEKQQPPHPKPLLGGSLASNNAFYWPGPFPRPQFSKVCKETGYPKEAMYLLAESVQRTFSQIDPISEAQSFSGNIKVHKEARKIVTLATRAMAKELRGTRNLTTITTLRDRTEEIIESLPLDPRNKTILSTYVQSQESPGFLFDALLRQNQFARFTTCTLQTDLQVLSMQIAHYNAAIEHCARTSTVKTIDHDPGFRNVVHTTALLEKVRRDLQKHLQNTSTAPPRISPIPQEGSRTPHSSTFDVSQSTIGQISPQTSEGSPISSVQGRRSVETPRVPPGFLLPSLSVSPSK